MNALITEEDIAPRAQFTGAWLDEEMLQAEFDAIIVAEWPAQPPTRI